MIWLLLVMAVCTAGGCAVVLFSDDVEIRQSGVDLDVVEEKEEGGTKAAPPAKKPLSPPEQ